MPLIICFAISPPRRPSSTLPLPLIYLVSLPLPFTPFVPSLSPASPYMGVVDMPLNGRGFWLDRMKRIYIFMLYRFGSPAFLGEVLVCLRVNYVEGMNPLLSRVIGAGIMVFISKKPKENRSLRPLVGYFDHVCGLKIQIMLRKGVRGRAYCLGLSFPQDDLWPGCTRDVSLYCCSQAYFRSPNLNVLFSYLFDVYIHYLIGFVVCAFYNTCLS